MQSSIQLLKNKIEADDDLFGAPVPIRALHGPATLTLITTYTCSAACRECCFECTPHVTGKLALTDITQAIDEASSQFQPLPMPWHG